MHTCLELRNQVLLIAAIVGLEDDVVGRGRAVVGDVKKVAVLLAQPHRSLVDPHEFAEHDHAVALLAGNRAIRELGDLLLEQVDRLILALANDLVLDPLGPLAGLGLDLILGRSDQGAVRLSPKSSGQRLEILPSVHPKDKADVTRFIPAVQMLGLAEVGVAPQGDPAKAGPPAQGDRLVEVHVGLLMGRAVALAIDQVERLGGVGQRDHQSLITPDPVLVDVDPLLALGVGLDLGPIGVHKRFLEEFRGLLGPDPQARFIDGVHQGLNVGLGETAAEVPFGGGVGDPLGAQSVEKDFIVAPQFDMLEPPAAGQDVEGDVQDMVGLVIGEMPLEQMERVIDVADQAGPLSQQQHDTDAAGGKALDTLAQLIVDVGGRDHGPLAFGAGAIGNPVENSPQSSPQQPTSAFTGLPTIASGDLFRDNNHHSKPSVAWKNEDPLLPPLFQNLRRFSSFSDVMDLTAYKITLGSGLVSLKDRL